jgi:hypothetical protein
MDDEHDSTQLKLLKATFTVKIDAFGGFPADLGRPI